MRKWFSKTRPDSSTSNLHSTSDLLLEKNPTVTGPEDPGSSWQRLKDGLKKTRTNLMSGLGGFFKLDQEITVEYWESLETTLLSADFGVKTTQMVLQHLQWLCKQHKDLRGDALKAELKQFLVQLLEPIYKKFVIQGDAHPHVILVVGVNGVGKTTTIAKLAAKYHRHCKLMMAAGDTFRAAAIEQLLSWGKKLDVPVVAQSSGSDAAAVIFDALQSAQARGIDVLFADTAGRLHTQNHLMHELQKIKRVMQKLDADAPQDVILVLDASIGQNAVSQVRLFHESMNLTGIVITKLDGTAKGGILFAIAQEFRIPCYFIGVGEGEDDLKPFDPYSFVQAILE